MKHVFADTNIFIHYRWFTEIAWGELVGEKEVTLVVSSVVLGELDKLKHDGSSAKKRSRAAGVLKRFDEILGDDKEIAEVAPGLLLAQPVDNSQATVDFAEHGLRRDVPDDCVIASVLAYTGRNPEVDAVLVTGDMGFRRKARSKGLAVLRPLESDYLEPEADPRDRELRELKREIAKRDARLPRLAVQSEAGGRHIRVTLPPHRVATEEEIQGELKRERALRDEPVRQITAARAKSSSVTRVLGDGPLHSLSDYSRRVERHLERYEEYLRAVVNRNAVVARCFPVKLSLHNEGTAIADDVDVSLEPRDRVTLKKNCPVPTEPRRPTPPSPPRHAAVLPGVVSQPSETIVSARQMASVSNFASWLGARTDSPGAFIESDDRCGGRFHVPRLKHNESIPLAQIWACFGTCEDVSNFSAAGKITTASHPDVFEFELHFVVEVESGE